MANYVSPGVYVVEKDFSEYPPSINSSVVGLVGFASKGPANKATLITSAAQLLRTFGRPDSKVGGYGLESALEILRGTNSLYFVRAATDAASDASAGVMFGACPAIALSTSASEGDVVNFNLTSTDNAGTAYTDTVQVTVGATSAISDYQNAFDRKAYRTGHFSVIKPQAGVALHAKLPADTYLYLVGAYAGSGASLTCSAGLEDGGAVNECGYAINQTDGSVALGAPQSDLTAYGVTAHKWDNGGQYTVKSLYTGSGYNFTSSVTNGVTINRGHSLTVTNYNGKDFTFDVNTDGVVDESFSMDFVDEGDGLGGLFPEKVLNVGADNAVSQWVKGEFTGYITGTDRDWTPPTQWDNVLTGGIKFGGTVNSGAHGAGAALTAGGADCTPRFCKLVEGTYNLAGGVNGDAAAAGISSAAEKAALIGDPASKTGLYALDDDFLNLSIAAVPGVTEQSVINSMVTLAEANKNFLAVTSPPMGLSSVQAAVNWHNGAGDGRDSAINSSYAAVYWPWVKVFDTFSKTDIWLPPEAFAITKMCETDAAAAPWFAPAGVTRGRLTKPFDTELIVNQGDRDTMYAGGNALNPIVKFAQDGIVIFGQRTAQRTPSALDRVNVRRMMILIRKMILAGTRQFAFEPNDAITWSRVRKVLVPMLQDIRDRRGITEFRVVCDNTTNTAVRIDRNELWCRVLIKPTKTAEIVIFEVNLTNQSADMG